jgi:methyl-accepting chemotaxis protein
MTSGRIVLAGPARRVAIVAGVVIALFAAAIAIMLWRYADVQDAYRRALAHRTGIERVEGAREMLHERGLEVTEAVADGAQPDEAELADSAARYQRFARASGEDQDLALHAAAARRFRELTTGPEQAALQASGTPAAERLLAAYVADIDRLETDVLDQIELGDRRNSQRLTASAESTARTGRRTALILGAIAIAGAMLLMAYVVRLLSRLIERIRHAAGTLAAALAGLRSAQTETAAATAEQAAAISEVATTVEELSATAATIAQNAHSANSAAEQTGRTMHEMEGQVQTVSERSLSLGERSQAIGQVLSLLDDIAERTNLLALNAAIEAARAGESGRGFAVVASEVRKLAERSVRSTDSIRELVTAIQDGTNATIMATEQGARQAQEVAELMRTTAEVLDESIQATEQQREAAGQVTTTMLEIRNAAEELAGEQRERTQVTERVDALVQELQRTLAEYGIETNGARPRDGA